MLNDDITISRPARLRRRTCGATLRAKATRLPRPAPTPKTPAATAPRGAAGTEPVAPNPAALAFWL